MPYEKRPVNQYDNDKSVEENIKNDAVVTPEIVNHLDSGIDLIQKETLKKMKEKIGGEVKAEPQDLSATTLGLITGNGGPINLESIPQDYSVTHKKTTFLKEIEENTADVSIMPLSLGKLGDYYVPGSGALANTPATITYKPTGKIITEEFESFFAKGVKSWIFYKTDGVYISSREVTDTEMATKTLVNLPANTGYMIGNVKDAYFYADDPNKSPYWIEPATAKASKMTYRYDIPGLIVEEGNLSENAKKFIDSASNGLAKEYKGEVLVNFGDSIIGNKNPSVSDFLAEYTGSTTINVGFGGCMMSPHPNADFANFSMSNLVDAIVSKNFSKQEASLSATGIPSGFRATITSLKAIDWTKVKTITISYGTNDWLNSNKIDNSADKYDKIYYLGALRYSVRKMQQAYPHLQIVVSPPIFRSTNDRSENANNWKNGNNEYLKDYANAVTNVAKELKILASDTFYGLGINEFNEGNYFPTNDGTHPNAKGRALLASKLAETIIYGASANPNVADVEKKVSEKANAKQEEWITPTLLNGWEPYAATSVPKYRKDAFGKVHFKGSVKRSSGTGVAFTLPAGYTHVGSVSYFITNSNNATFGLVYISNGTNVNITSTTTPHISLDGISFYAE